MPKEDLVDPTLVRAPGAIRFEPIPVNLPPPPLPELRASLGDDRLRLMLRDMIVIRAFEQMLSSIKRDGRYRGIDYVHRGPAHLAIGQEAAAVGEAAALAVDDLAFGSHRSHAEVLAKGLGAVESLPEAALVTTMEAANEGAILRSIEALPAVDARARGSQFLLLGLLAEIFGRSNGFNRGLGGSMHACFPPFGVYPNNAIVGGSAPIATGAAMFQALIDRPAIVVANIGDGATGCGPVWEAMNFASMGQIRRWHVPPRDGLPVLFFVVNNFYAMGGQTATETMGFDQVARMAAPFGQHSMHAEVVDGNDPLAVMDAVRRQRELLINGRGPAFVDCQCYRQSGHSTSDASSYRTAEEIDGWRAVDPITEYARRLRQAGIIDDGWPASQESWAEALVLDVLRVATDDRVSPRLDPRVDGTAISRHMFAGIDVARVREPVRDGDLLVSPGDVPRIQQLSMRDRHGLSPNGQRLPSTRTITMRVALFEAIVDAVQRDRHLVIYGEENRDWGGAFGVYQGLTELLPSRRLFNAPVSEAAIVGTAVGYAMAGGRALVELMYADFIGRAGDELFNQLPKWHAMSGGAVRTPVVVRVSVGSKYGAQHSQDWTGLVAHIPGLKVVYPATPFDAKGLLATALTGEDPVVFFESQKLYDVGEWFRSEGVPPQSYEVPLGVPELRRSGSDLTIATIGPALYPALQVCNRLDREYGVSAELIDLRCLVPLDLEPIVTSVRKTGRLVLVSDAVVRGSFLNSIAAEAQLQAFEHLDAPVTVIGAPNWVTPAAELEDAFFPTPDRILDVIAAVILPLPNRPAPPDERAARAASWRSGL